MIKSIIFLLNILVIIKLSDAGCYLSNHTMTEDCRFKNFYNFGTSAGDKKMPADDDHHERVEMPTQFKFFDKHFTALYASTNGVIKLVNENDRFDNVLDLHNEFYYNSVRFPIYNHSLIAPFWTDMSPHRKDSHTFYRIATDKTTLNRVFREVESFMPSASSFGPEWAVIITWFQLSANQHTRFGHNNTFQLVISSDGIQSYVIFNYGPLAWPNEKVKVNVVSGYNVGDNERFFEMAESFTPNIVNLQHRSNVNIPGKWIFCVDGHFLKGEPIQKSFVHSGEHRHLLYILLILIILIGINSLVSTGLWINVLMRNRSKVGPVLQMKYNKQLNESQMNLTQDV